MREHREENWKIISDRIGENRGEKIIIGRDTNARTAEKAEEIVGEKSCSKDKCMNNEEEEFLKIIKVGLGVGNGSIEGNEEGKWTYIGPRGRSVSQEKRKRKNN